MKPTLPTPAADDEAPPGMCGRSVRLVRAAMEGVVLLMVCLSPWAFGSVDPFWEFVLFAGVGVLLTLWAAVMLLEGRLTWRKCPVALCLAALYLLGVFQATPLPRQVLAVVSPAAVRLYAQLLPAQPEVLPAGEARSAPPYAPGSTISLYPGATQRELTRVLAVFLVFAAVRNNIASPRAFRRLAVAATANGTLLSLFALVQFFNSPHDRVYWALPAPGGEVFGPFICRNHFSFYTNQCVGLAAGLLLSFCAPATGRAPRGDDDVRARREERLGALVGAVQDPRKLWVGIALVLMIGAVALSLSRGGFLALIGAATLSLALVLWRSPRLSRLGGVVLLAGSVVALLAWFGADRVQARLATVWQGQALRQDRVPLWSRLLPSAAEYPILGTGYGTFDYVEPLTRVTGKDAGYRYEHAHNDYLEALLEGGLVRLGLSLLAVALVYRFGCRAFIRKSADTDGALALGAVLGFTAVAIHSFVDFGLHIPAIALLAAVSCAHLCAAGDRQARGAAEPDRYSFRLLGLAPVAGAAAAVVLGVMLAGQGWRAARVEEYRETASRLRRGPELERRRLGLAYLDAAAALAPEYAVLHAQAGEAHLDLMHEEADALTRSAQAADAVQAVTALGAGPGPAGGVASWFAAAAARSDWLAARNKALTDAHLVRGLRAFLHARDACPLLADVHMQLAAHVGDLHKAGPRSDYVRRAKLLAPGDPDVWYLCGIEEAFDGGAEEARKSWRRSLALSPRRLPEIVGWVARDPDAANLLEQVLPERASDWLAAADHLYADQQAPERKPLLEKALALLDAQEGRLDADELHRKAALCVSLGRGAEGLAAYQQALDQRPDQTGWRFEFARLLHDEGRLQDSRRELSDILAEAPGDAQALQLLESVAHDIAEGR